MPANHFGPVERAVLHHHIRRAVRQGSLGPKALQAFEDGDWRLTLEEAVSGTYDEDAVLTTTSVPGGRPFLQWLISHLPQILALIVQLLPLFTGSAVSAAGLNEAMPVHAAMPTSFAIPPGTGVIISEIIQALLPVIENIIKKHLPQGSAN